MNDQNVVRLPRPGGDADRPVPEPTTVWLTGQRDLDAQLADGDYQAPTRRDTDAIPPAVATYAIAAYSPPGGTVLDPDCGAGTTIVEALRAGRNAIGLTASHRRWTRARADVTAVKATGAAFDGMVLILDRSPTTLPSATAALAGRVDLILTAFRPSQADPLIALGKFRDLLDGCAQLLNPRGHLVIVTRPHRHLGQPLDIPTQVRTIAKAAGFLPVERCVALTAGLRRHRVITRASLAQRRAAAHHHRTTGHPITLPAHLDVLVFQPARSASAVLARPTPLQPIPALDVPRPREAAQPWGRSA